ncbi:MAG: hypothetical protein A2381_17205 [Bdellovibrionales bacterium RIFOXYB1_FULL_37_110]|nr:MAG: hypothetical protein A2181_08210 [Bdellovibrionales bacterium RIFOXYA1_FULL_38_20]OFZ50133.1 MAG: hypothetical protein A2417_19040 [Bdellovibrionales bacterium RIFOXYC1_FULL_37_79]OFZ60039.1 MAG: hypothetical protein A2381_17205 [Bdellovibrionales bacterium RIFOXYB1_FULL_37_110]OFZ63027.1 MAG: hypothetical protein A2577_08910 [Bdellovibrionales bacterium RIFOXYD1_FULL_36_51]
MNTNLNTKLMAIGFVISGVGSAPHRSGRPEFIDIEQTLTEALVESKNDFRLASLIFSWVAIHGDYVIVEKLFKIIHTDYHRDLKDNVWPYALAAFAMSKKIHKWKKLTHKFKEGVYAFPKEMSELPIKQKGAASWAKKFNILIPEDSIRIRETDILSPEELIKNNLQYKNRYLFGVSYRADIITAIQLGYETPSQISKLIQCSYEPAHRIFNEYRMAT